MQKKQLTKPPLGLQILVFIVLLVSFTLPLINSITDKSVTIDNYQNALLFDIGVRAFYSVLIVTLIPIALLWHYHQLQVSLIRKVGTLSFIFMFYALFTLVLFIDIHTLATAYQEKPIKVRGACLLETNEESFRDTIWTTRKISLQGTEYMVYTPQASAGWKRLTPDDIDKCVNKQCSCTAPVTATVLPSSQLVIDIKFIVNETF